MIRIGTDCSGMDAPIHALKQLKIPYVHEFSCENDKHCIETIMANTPPKQIFTDIMTRNHSRLPRIDLYVCGFPCQPFSSSGQRNGFEDTRGTVFFECLRTIQATMPKAFILENVRGILSHDGGRTFKIIMESLQSLRKYEIFSQILDTKHYGIPQSRPRVYIVGILKEYHQGVEEKNLWPRPVKMKNLRDYIDSKDCRREVISERGKSMLDKLPRGSVFVDLTYANQNTYPNSDKICPCLLRVSQLWCVPMHRKANVKEHLSLQGFQVSSFKQVVSDSQLKKQIGNSMSLCVLKPLLKNIIEIIR